MMVNMCKKRFTCCMLSQMIDHMRNYNMKVFLFVFEILLKVFVFEFKYICILEYLYLIL